MINGHLSEAQQGFALLEDVDEDTFVRFTRWMYSKDYSTPEHTIAIAEPSNPESAPEATVVDEDLDDWGSFTTKKKKKKVIKEKVGKGNLKESFISQDPLSSEIVWIPGARSNKSPQEDYTEVFLSHARLYVFAEKYDIQPLKKLCLQKLQHTLAIFTLYPERVGDVTTLLKYVYANTADSGEGKEDIRTMLAHYVGCEMEVLEKNGEIRELMLDDGEMLGDFLRMFALRVS